MSSPELGSTTRDRAVGYVHESILSPGDDSWIFSRQEELSGNLHRVQDPRLRYALRLADAVQVLDLMEYPQDGGFPGGVKTYGDDYHKPFLATRDSPRGVVDELPGDVMERIEQWYYENNQSQSTGS